MGASGPQTQPLSNSGTVLLDTQWAYAHYGRSLSEAVELLRMWSENLYTARGDQPLSWSRRSIYNWPLCSGSFVSRLKGRAISGLSSLKAQRPSQSEICSRHKGRVGLKFAQGTKAEPVCSRCRAAIAFSTWFASIVVTPAPLLLPAVRFVPRPLRRRRLVSRCFALQHAVLDEARTAILVIDAVARADCAHKLAVGHRCVSIGRSSRSSYRFS